MALLKRTSTDDLSATTSPAPAPATPLLAPSTPPPAPVSFAQQLMKMDDVQLATKLSCAEAHPQWDEFLQGVHQDSLLGDTLKTLLAFELWLQSGNARPTRLSQLLKVQLWMLSPNLEVGVHHHHQFQSPLHLVLSTKVPVMLRWPPNHMLRPMRWMWKIRKLHGLHTWGTIGLYAALRSPAQ